MKKVLILVLILLTTCVSAQAAVRTPKKLPKEALEGKGYMGSLPVLGTQFRTQEEGKSNPVYENTQDFHSANQVKQVPRDNPAFVNIILKADKTSAYLNDINDLLPVVEKIHGLIEDKGDVQKFNAAVFYYTRCAEHLRDKYDQKPEGNYVSFRKILSLSTHAQTIATLRSEAVQYNSYLAYGGAGALYNQDNLDQQIEYLKYEIEQTIVAIKEAE
jgi:hypothetical protein